MVGLQCSSQSSNEGWENLIYLFMWYQETKVCFNVQIYQPALFSLWLEHCVCDIDICKLLSFWLFILCMKLLCEPCVIYRVQPAPKSSPGKVVSLELCPINHNLMLIGYENGLIVLWDFENSFPTKNFPSNLQDCHMVCRCEKLDVTTYTLYIHSMSNELHIHVCIRQNIGSNMYILAAFSCHFCILDCAVENLLPEVE